MTASCCSADPSSGSCSAVSCASAAAVSRSAVSRHSRLAARIADGHALEAADVAVAAAHGDPVAIELLTHSGRLVGETVATLVNFFNPSLVLLGGGVAASGDHILRAVRETVYRRSLPLATRDLRIERSTLTPDPALSGAAHMVLDELFSRQQLGRWLPTGSPAGIPKLGSAVG